jgi:hypothetical protein
MDTRGILWDQAKLRRFYPTFSSSNIYQNWTALRAKSDAPRNQTVSSSFSEKNAQTDWNQQGNRPSQKYSHMSHLLMKQKYLLILSN